ncbi:MAG: hypothetical protein R3D71_06290 [Rickettsiales bacterium]
MSDHTQADMMRQMQEAIGESGLDPRTQQDLMRIMKRATGGGGIDTKAIERQMVESYQRGELQGATPSSKTISPEEIRAFEKMQKDFMGAGRRYSPVPKEKTVNPHERMKQRIDKQRVDQPHLGYAGLTPRSQVVLDDWIKTELYDPSRVPPLGERGTSWRYDIFLDAHNIPRDAFNREAGKRRLFSEYRYGDYDKQNRAAQLAQELVNAYDPNHANYNKWFNEQRARRIRGGSGEFKGFIEFHERKMQRRERSSLEVPTRDLAEIELPKNVVRLESSDAAKVADGKQNLPEKTKVAGGKQSSVNVA